MNSNPLRSGIFLSILVLIALIATTTVNADDDDRARRLQRSGQILSLDQIFDNARTIRPGRILEVELDEDNGQYIYQLEVLDRQGRVWEMELDARTGQLIELKQDD